MRPSPILLCALLAATFVASACAPRLTPPYRDFRIPAPDTSLVALLRDATTESGWQLAPSPDPLVVSTVARPVGSGLVSDATASVELVPLGGRTVRVWVRAERRGFLGGRSRVFGLSASMREEVLGALTEALARRGLVALRPPAERDRASR